MATKPDRWGNQDVTVTLKGKEWFALIAYMTGRALSEEGAMILKKAKADLAKQVKRTA